MSIRSDTCSAVTPAQLWSATNLSPRVKRLRDQYWSFYDRAYSNGVRSYTTGTEWDSCYSIWSWTNVGVLASWSGLVIRSACRE